MTESSHVPVRRFNDLGREAFRSAMDRFLADPSTDLTPRALAYEDSLTELASGSLDVAAKFSSRYDLAKGLLPLVAPVDGGDFRAESGQMDWLACALLPVLMIDNGAVKAGELARYISTDGYTKVYRHLIAGPLETYATAGEASRFLLSNPPHTPGDIYEQLASRIEIRTNPGAMAAASTLYMGSDQKPKRGTRSKTRAGNLRRFIDLVKQLDLTFDVFAMDADELLAVLPKEFDDWRPAPVVASVA